MQIEFLGSGGAFTIPRPGCRCRVCVEGRTKGIPYSRSGPGIFVHGPDVLIDTSEDIRAQLNRSDLQQIPACFYSHWHPDHVMGRRIWETLNLDLMHWPPQSRSTDIYLPEQVAADFRQWLGSWDHFKYLERLRLVRLVELIDGDVITLNGVNIRPFRLARDYVYAFMFEEGKRRALIAPDELLGWQPPDEMCGVDLAVIPMGITEFDPFSGERHVPETHPMLKIEATFNQMLEIARRLDARHVVMTHIEEPDQLGYDDLLRLEEKLHGEGLNITFAYDTLVVPV